MRIALLGNHGQSFFVLMRYLRDRGADVTLLLSQAEAPNDHPSYDSSNREDYARTLSLTFGDGARITAHSPAFLREAFAPYDRLVVQGPLAAFVERAGRTIDLLIPYGEDVTRDPFLRVVRPRRGAARSLWTFPSDQRRAIAKARRVLLPALDPELAGALASSLDRIGTRGERIFGDCPRIYEPSIDAEAARNRSSCSIRAEMFREWRGQPDSLVYFYRGPESVDRQFDPVLRALIGFAHRNGIGIVSEERGAASDSLRDVLAQEGGADACLLLPPLARKEYLLTLSACDGLLSGDPLRANTDRIDAAVLERPWAKCFGGDGPGYERAIFASLKRAQPAAPSESVQAAGIETIARALAT